MLRTKKFWGLEFVDQTWGEWRAWLGKRLGKKGELVVVMTPNSEQLVLADSDQEFRECLKKASVRLPDGVGVVKYGGMRARLTGVETVEEILRLSKLKKWKVLLVGGRYTATAKNGRLLVPLGGDDESELFYIEGYRNVVKVDQNEEKAVQDMIADLKPVIVLVALGAPAQEKWLCTNWEFLSKNGVQLAMAVGGSLDFLLGKVRRAPESWQKAGLEWLWRLKEEPWRWRRQLALVKFWWKAQRRPGKGA